MILEACDGETADCDSILAFLKAIKYASIRRFTRILATTHGLENLSAFFLRNHVPDRDNIAAGDIATLVDLLIWLHDVGVPLGKKQVSLVDVW